LPSPTTTMMAATPAAAWSARPGRGIPRRRRYRWLSLAGTVGSACSNPEPSARCGNSRREGVDNSYVSRMVNLTVLSPEIVARLLDDDLPDHVALFGLAVDPPAGWAEQWGRVGL
jgi:hypothetical protein